MKDLAKKIITPFKKVPEDSKIISPDYKGKLIGWFAKTLFGKANLLDLLEFSIPSGVSLASNVYASFESKMNMKASFLSKG